MEERYIHTCGSWKHVSGDVSVSVRLRWWRRLVSSITNVYLVAFSCFVSNACACLTRSAKNPFCANRERQNEPPFASRTNGDQCRFAISFSEKRIPRGIKSRELPSPRAWIENDHGDRNRSPIDRSIHIYPMSVSRTNSRWSRCQLSQNAESKVPTRREFLLTKIQPQIHEIIHSTKYFSMVLIHSVYFATCRTRDRLRVREA